ALDDSLGNRLGVARRGRCSVGGLLANLVGAWTGGSTTAKRDQAECCNDDPFHPDLDASGSRADACRPCFFCGPDILPILSYNLGDSRFTEEAVAPSFGVGPRQSKNLLSSCRITTRRNPKIN